jgi:hypothetical protein
MSELDVDRVEVCPWALREGILLRRLAPLPGPDALRHVELIESSGATVSRLDDRRQHRHG